MGMKGEHSYPPSMKLCKFTTQQVTLSEPIRLQHMTSLSMGKDWTLDLSTTCQWTIAEIYYWVLLVCIKKYKESLRTTGDLQSNDPM